VSIGPVGRRSLAGVSDDIERLSRVRLRDSEADRGFVVMGIKKARALLHGPEVRLTPRYGSSRQVVRVDPGLDFGGRHAAVVEVDGGDALGVETVGELDHAVVPARHVVDL
jgi:hypothetical protein